MNTPGNARKARARRKAAGLLAKVALNIKKYRANSGLTQEELQERTRVTISRHETGKYDMTLSTLHVISESLNVDAYKLLQ